MAQTGEKLWLEDLRGKWVLVRKLDAAMEYSATQRPLRLQMPPDIDATIDRRNLVVLNVYRHDMLSRLQAACERQQISDPVLRVYEEANWGDMEWGEDYLISPTGLVVLAEPEGQAGGFDWNAALPSFLAQPGDFSPARISVLPVWSEEGDFLDIHVSTYCPGGESSRCRLELTFDYSESLGEVNRREQVEEYVSPSTGINNNPKSFHYSELQGCHSVSYKASIYDGRVKQWISRYGGLLGPGTGDAGSRARQGTNAAYDSQYRAPSSPR